MFVSSALDFVFFSLTSLLCIFFFHFFLLYFFRSCHKLNDKACLGTVDAKGILNIYSCDIIEQNKRKYIKQFTCSFSSNFGFGDFFIVFFVFRFVHFYYFVFCITIEYYFILITFTFLLFVIYIVLLYWFVNSTATLTKLCTTAVVEDDKSLCLSLDWNNRVQQQ